MNERDNILTRQLLYEFQYICFTYSVELRPPIFELCDVTSYLGKWCPKTRVLSISKRVVDSCGWQDVIDILKHEMAHQMCSELFPGDGNLPHGDAFQHACDVLQLRPQFRKATLSDVLLSKTQSQTSKRDSQIEKVLKLFQLAESNNLNEAESAFAKAKLLMEKYAIDHCDLDKESEVVHHVIETTKKRVDRYQACVVSLLTRFFNVNCIRSKLYDPQKDASLVTFEIIGRKHHVEIAEHCYEFLMHQVASAWDEKRSSLGTHEARKAKNAFCLGVMDGFERKLTKLEMSKANIDKSSQRNAISVQNDVEVKSYMVKRYPKLRTVQNRALNLNAMMYKDGSKKGEKISLKKGVKKGQLAPKLIDII